MSTKSEYMALAHAVKEGVWLRYVISEIQGEKLQTMGLNCDNEGALALSKDNSDQSTLISITTTFETSR